MLWDLFITALNHYDHVIHDHSEEWEEEVDYQVDRCLDAGKSYSLCLDVIHLAYERA